MGYLKNVLLLASLAVVTACSSLPTDFDSVDSYAYTDTAQTELGKTATQVTGDDAVNSTMHLIREGAEAFLTRMVLLSEAGRSIDVQYFIWRSDLIGKQLMNKMRRLQC